jgi:aspartyl-tRNA(Asn)/glutamyl-tRNA(Gln) amidotransferase subunit A
MTNQLAFSSLTDMARGLRERAYTSEHLTQLYLDRIARLDEKAHAYIAVYKESALLQARAADLQRQAGLPLPPLHGLPIAVKDLCDIEGKVTTAGSLAWKERRSPVTSAVVERLQAAGMILLGKTHTVEFAFGGWGTNQGMGTPRNPWDWNRHHRGPGGSSSGSGVAVAAGLAPAAIGTDTAGSVRIPASFNGLTGLKSTYGLISLFGTVPLAPSFDSIGTLTRTAEDAAVLTEALAGFDWRDPGSRHRPHAGNPAPPVSIPNLRIAVMHPSQYPSPVENDVQSATDEAVKVFQSLGARIEHVEVPLDLTEVLRLHLDIIAAEAYRFHAGYIEDAKLPFGDAIRQRIIGGKSIDSNMYISALARRRESIAIFHDWMQSYDVLLTPTLPLVARPLEEIDEAKTPAATFARAINYLDTCAISLPAGFSGEGLPIGVQLIAKPWQENLLVQAGKAFQQVTDWHRRTPPDLQ